VSVLCVTTAFILVSDQLIKIVLRRFLGNDALALGACGSIRIAARRIWLGRIGIRLSGSVLWCIWVVAAATLISCSAFAPISPVFVGLLVGASLSHVLEASMRGSVTDYICVRTWLMLNLADLALFTGAFGLVWELVEIVRRGP
jgi:hypothetical protein